MTERETQVIEVQGHTFVIKTYATAREAATIQQTYFKDAKVEIAGQEPKITEFNPGAGFDVQLEMVKQMVVSVDSIEKDVVLQCEQLPSDVFTELLAQLDAIVSKKKS